MFGHMTIYDTTWMGDRVDEVPWDVHTFMAFIWAEHIEQYVCQALLAEIAVLSHREFCSDT
jgi:hypothetical protein